MIRVGSDKISKLGMWMCLKLSNPQSESALFMSHQLIGRDMESFRTLSVLDSFCAVLHLAGSPGDHVPG